MANPNHVITDQWEREQELDRAEWENLQAEIAVTSALFERLAAATRRVVARWRAEDEQREAEHGHHPGDH